MITSLALIWIFYVGLKNIVRNLVNEVRMVLQPESREVFQVEL
jgi:hypothetical protein